MMSIGSENSFVDKWRMTTELFKSFAWFQTVYSAKQNVRTIIRALKILPR